MFSKHVWYDRKHQAEVFITDEGVISGTMVAYDGAVCMINPRPEVLLALYQEAKIKRILSVKSVIITDNSIALTRGLCAFVNYCRGLRRRSSLSIVTHADTSISKEFLMTGCMRLWSDSSFELQYAHLGTGESFELGKGRIRFVAPPEGSDSSRPFLEVSTDRDRSLHFYDESHRGQLPTEPDPTLPKPNVVIRAAELPRYLREVREKLAAMG